MWWLDPEVALRGADAEIETVKWFRSVIEPGMTVIDVGANVGQMTLEMAHLVGPTGRVIAIEPGPGNLAVLRRHVEGNGFADRVKVIAAACCTRHGGKMELDIPGKKVDAVGSGFQLSGIGIAQNPATASRPSAKLLVNTVSLDGLMEELKISPAVLKIDVEGAEIEVLRGGRDMLRKNRPALSVGFHPFAFKQPAAAQAEILALGGEAGLRFHNQEREPWVLGEYIASP
jgi:FkbM family methyltransferase